MNSGDTIHNSWQEEEISMTLGPWHGSLSEAALGKIFSMTGDPEEEIKEIRLHDRRGRPLGKDGFDSNMISLN